MQFSLRTFVAIFTIILLPCVASGQAKSIDFLADESLSQFTTVTGKPVNKGWRIVDGVLERYQRGGHIVTKEIFGNFELEFEWRVPEGGNSGIKYRVKKYGKKTLGCEYQLFDDRKRKLKPSAKGSTAALYALYGPSADKQLKPAGEFNHSRIIVSGNSIQHFLNGQLVVDAIAGSADWRNRVKKSKFSDATDFGENVRGRIMIQDHGSGVWFRKLKLTSLPERPSSMIPGVEIELFAEHPQLWTPTGIAVDAKGKVYVAESNTHFRPDNYDGPKTDRILVFEDQDGDGKPDKRTVFHEGFTHLMDIEFHHDGALYVATRKDIHRMRDTNGDGKADKVERIIDLVTTGTYPHNGISGLAFDFSGNLNFGLGENLGHDYKIVGTDGRTFSGGGEGGSTYWVRADGTQLRRTSTGWWNPFGMCVDRFGRVFGTDNDPGASPPCRLIQLFEGADYGYEYRYGRTGLHPLITWTGRTTGTIPMVDGTGEAPCEIRVYPGGPLPLKDQLLVACWADHRVDRYVVSQDPRQGLSTVKRSILIQGDAEFRPVGIAVAPNGDIYVSDWVSSSYTLHKLGRIWRIRPKKKDVPVTDNYLEGEAHARKKLVEKKVAELKQVVSTESIHGVGTLGGESDWLSRIAQDQNHSMAVRQLALHYALAGGAEVGPWIKVSTPPALAIEALQRADAIRHEAAILRYLKAHPNDPVLVHFAVEVLRKQLTAGGKVAEQFSIEQPGLVLLATKRSGARNVDSSQLRKWLGSTDSRVRYLAVKWIADEKLNEFKGDLQRLLKAGELDYRLFLATTEAISRIEGRKPQDVPNNRFLVNILNDESSNVDLLTWSLRLTGMNSNGLNLERVSALTHHKSQQVAVEAIRLLGRIGGDDATATLRELAKGDPSSKRLEAIHALAQANPKASNGLLVNLACDKDMATAEAAVQSLVGRKIKKAFKAKLATAANQHPQLAEAYARLLDKLPDRPTSAATSEWEELVKDDGDADAGERVFFAQNLVNCGKCHQRNGRGIAVGPDLSMMVQRLKQQPNPKRWLLQTILQPSAEMAPQYTPWVILTVDGKQHVGLPRRKGGNAEAYLGLDGREFNLKKDQIETHRESNKSIMPDDLLRQLTKKEIRDLLAFLQAEELH